jgi:hypothetical protein
VLTFDCPSVILPLRAFLFAVMSTEIKKEIQLEIAHVLFIDIVAYSKLSINEPTRCDSLNEPALGQVQSPFSFFRELRAVVSVERGEKWKQQPEWQSASRPRTAFFRFFRNE